MFTRTNEFAIYLLFALNSVFILSFSLLATHNVTNNALLKPETNEIWQMNYHNYHWYELTAVLLEYENFIPKWFRGAKSDSRKCTDRERAWQKTMLICSWFRSLLQKKKIFYDSIFRHITKPDLSAQKFNKSSSNKCSSMDWCTSRSDWNFIADRFSNDGMQLWSILACGWLPIWIRHWFYWIAPWS